MLQNWNKYIENILKSLYFICSFLRISVVCNLCAFSLGYKYMATRKIKEHSTQHGWLLAYTIYVQIHVVVVFNKQLKSH